VGHWVCIEFEEERIKRLEREGKVLGYCELIIETEEEWDACDQLHYYYQVTTSIGKYEGRYEEDPYSSLFEALKEDGWQGPYKTWEADEPPAHLRLQREIWVRLRPEPRPSVPDWNYGRRTANLAGADLRTARIPEILRAQGIPQGEGLKGANLEGANLEGVSLSGKNLAGANLRGVHARGANLARCWFDSADLSYADLRGANLEETSMDGAILDGANLEGAVLQVSSAEGASFQGANLRGANLYRIQARGASLVDADLTNANLRDATLVNASLTGANLTNADVFFARFRGTGLTMFDLRSARNADKAGL
jgi:uncharacterized protein YjbI with pentapeptide repeats